MSEMTNSGMGGDTSFIMRIFGDDSGVRRFMGLGIWIGAWTDGRLGRIGYLIAALTLYGLLGLVQWLLIGFMTPDPIQLTPTSQPMSEFMQMASIAAMIGASALTLIIGMNIAAKRIRAIGAPGWGGAIAITVINAAAFLTIPQFTYPWLSLGIMVLLMALPNGLLKRA